MWFLILLLREDCTKKKACFLLGNRRKLHTGFVEDGVAVVETAVAMQAVYKRFDNMIRNLGKGCRYSLWWML